jgi:hypothetical protein
MKRSAVHAEVMDIRFERADKGLGLSIAGGLGSTPYKVSFRFNFFGQTASVHIYHTKFTVKIISETYSQKCI